MSADQSNLPTWLDEPCPPWCARVHDEGDHPEDRVHQGEPSIVPAVLLRDSPTLADDRREVPGEVLAQAMRALGSSRTWVLICEPEDVTSMTMLDASSAGELADALRRVVDELEE